MKKSFLIYLIALLFVTGFLGYVVLSKNKNNQISNEVSISSDNWVLYNNNNLGISFKYPKDWFIQNSLGDLTIADTSELIYYGEPFNTNAKYANWAGVIFKFHKLEKDFSWNNFFSYYNEIEKWSLIDGWRNAIEITELSGIFPGDPHYFIKTDNQVIEIYGLNVYYEEYQEKQIILEKIINSLKITK